MLEFRNVVKKFGERTILNDLSFKTKKGEILFILGTSGTGKSVLLKLIVGLLNVTSGEIWLDSEKISNFTEEELFSVRKKCGMVFQHPALFDSLTVFENVSYGIRPHLSGLSKSEINQRVIESLEVVDLGEDLLNKKASKLSYGVQKRVSLARTLALKPEVLLFDEPTTGLDPVTTQSVNKLILNSSRKYQSTSLVVSHDMDSALTVADRILVLSKGEIVELATPSEIRESKVPLVKEFLSEVLDREEAESV
ncbi:MAG: ATP-binding cassette domain-containing protein [Bdellovibrionales bacterium]|nr:ATP-binding cassette domain-containing protein [Bdellovibrionales bacterium]